MPDMEGKGKRRVYPKLDAYRLLNNDELVKDDKPTEMSSNDDRMARRKAVVSN